MSNTVADLKLVLQACHSKRRQGVINSGAWLIDEPAPPPAPPDYPAQLIANAEAYRKGINTARAKAPPVYLHKALEPIILRMVNELNLMQDNEDVTAYAREHVPELRSLFLSLFSPPMESHGIPLSAVYRNEADQLRKVLDAAESEWKENSGVDYVEQQREHDVLVSALKRLHPVYDIQSGWGTGVSYLPEHITALVPKLVLRLERTHPSKMADFLQNDPEAAMVINTALACAESAAVVGGPFSALQKAATKYRLASLGADYGSGEHIAANEKGVESNPFGGIRQSLERPSREELKASAKKTLEALGAREVSFRDDVPYKFTIDAQAFIQHGKEIFERYPSVRGITFKDTDDKLLKSILTMQELDFLSSVDFSYNTKLGDEAAEMIAHSEHLGGCKAMILSGCPISSIGFRALAGALDKKLRGLEELYMKDGDDLAHLGKQVVRDLQKSGRECEICFA